jgi:aminopeptidase N
VFRTAIRQYMKAHAYGNANTADLWRALEDASGKPVGAVASAYTEQAGVPLVVAETSCVAGEQRIALTQDRFTIRDGEAKPQRWKVPVMLGPAGAAQASETVLLDGTGEVTAGRCGDPIKLNFGDVGYYRVRYDGTMQSALARVMTGMPPADRVNLLADAWAMIESNRSPPAAFLDLADQLSGDDHRSVADQVIRVLSRMDQFERGRPARAAYRAFARATLRPVFDRVGWDGMPGEAEERALLRSALVRALGDLGDETILTEARKRFAAFLNDPKSLHPDLRDPVTHLVGRHANRAMYDQLLALARKTTNGDERTRYYSAIAGALDPALAKETLALTISDDFSTSRVTTVIQRVASQGEHAELAWTFVKENYAKVADKLGSNSRNRFLTNLMSNFSDRAHADELKAFKPLHENSGGRMVAERAYEQILANADFVAQQLPAIDDWIKQRAAAQ